MFLRKSRVWTVSFVFTFDSGRIADWIGSKSPIPAQRIDYSTSKQFRVDLLPTSPDLFFHQSPQVVSTTIDAFLTENGLELEWMNRKGELWLIADREVILKVPSEQLEALASTGKVVTKNIELAQEVTPLKLKDPSEFCEEVLQRALLTNGYWCGNRLASVEVNAFHGHQPVAY